MWIHMWISLREKLIESEDAFLHSHFSELRYIFGIHNTSVMWVFITGVFYRRKIQGTERLYDLSKRAQLVSGRVNTELRVSDSVS